MRTVATKAQKLILAFIVLLSPLTLMTGQARPGFSSQSSKSGKRVAKMFDEFGALNYCSITARLDNFAIEVQNNPGLHGYLIIYGSPGEEIGSGTHTVQLLKRYLVEARGLEDERLTTIYAGRNDVLKEVRVQLWLAPNGVAAPEPAKFDTKPESFKGLFDQDEGYDEVLYATYEGEGEGEDLFPGVWLASFADMIQSQPNSLVYVVGYNGDVSVPGAWRRIAQNEVEALKKANVDSNRFKIIYGGNEEKAKVQIWVQPANEPPPVKDAGPEPALVTSVQLGDFGDLELGEKKLERLAFNRLADTLRSYPTLRACLIVRLEQPQAKADETTEMSQQFPMQVFDEALVDPSNSEAEPVEPDSEPADLLKLVESWKNELAKQNIREDRLVILFSKALPETPGSLETWLIPKGLSLPDPDEIFRQESKSQNAQTPNQQSGKP